MLKQLNRFPQPFVWVGVILCVYLLYQLTPVLPPFLIAVIFSYLANPAVTRLEKVGIARSVTIAFFTVLVVVALVLFVFLLWPIIKDQGVRFSQLLPEYIDRLRNLLQWANQADVSNLDELPSMLENNASVTTDTSPESAPQLPEDSPTDTASEANSSVDPLIELMNNSLPGDQSTVGTTVSMIQQSLGALVGFFSSLFLIPVLGFYLLRDWHDILNSLLHWIPSRYRTGVSGIAQAVDEVLGQFLRGQVIVMFSLCVIYGAGLLLIGIDFAILIAVVAGLLSFVPFLGTAIGLLMALASVLAQSPSWLGAGQVILVFLVGQFIEGNYLTPKLVGDKVGLHPVAVIFALAAGAQLFGFTGLLLALPGGAILWTIIKHLSENGRIAGTIELPPNHEKPP